MATTSVDLDSLADAFVGTAPPAALRPRTAPQPRHPLANPQSAEFQAMAKQYGLDPGEMGRLLHVESAGNAIAVSPKGAQGVFQLMPSVQQDYGVTDPFDPGQNVPAAMQYMRDLLKRYKGDKRLAYAAWNAGPGTVDKLGRVPNYPETQALVTKVVGEQPSVAPGYQPPVDLEQLADAFVGGPRRPSPLQTGTAPARLEEAQGRRLLGQPGARPPTSDEARFAPSVQPPSPPPPAVAAPVPSPIVETPGYPAPAPRADVPGYPAPAQPVQPGAVMPGPTPEAPGMQQWPPPGEGTGGPGMDVVYGARQGTEQLARALRNGAQLWGKFHSLIDPMGRTSISEDQWPAKLEQAATVIQDAVRVDPSLLQDRTRFDQRLLQAIGQTVPQLAALVGLTATGMGAPVAMGGLAALTEADKGLGASLWAGLKGFVFGKVMTAMAPLPPVAQIPLAGTVAGATTYAETRDPQQALVSALTAAGLQTAMVGPRLRTSYQRFSDWVDAQLRRQQGRTAGWTKEDILRDATAGFREGRSAADVASGLGAKYGMDAETARNAAAHAYDLYVNATKRGFGIGEEEAPPAPPPPGAGPGPEAPPGPPPGTGPGPRPSAPAGGGTALRLPQVTQTEAFRTARNGFSLGYDIDQVTMALIRGPLQMDPQTARATAEQVWAEMHGEVRPPSPSTPTPAPVAESAVPSHEPPAPLPDPRETLRTEVATRLPGLSAIDQDALTDYVLKAQTFGVMDTIEQWAVQGLTRNQITDRLRANKRVGRLDRFDTRDMVNGVHTFLGIPPNENRPAFRAWQQAYQQGKTRETMVEKGLETPPLTPEQQAIEDQMLGDVNTPTPAPQAPEMPDQRTSAPQRQPTPAPRPEPGPVRQPSTGPAQTPEQRQWAYQHPPATPGAPPVAPPPAGAFPEEALPPPEAPGLWPSAPPGQRVPFPLPPAGGPIANMPPPAYLTPGPSDVIPGDVPPSAEGVQQQPYIRGEHRRELGQLQDDLRLFFHDVNVGGIDPSGPRTLTKAGRALRERTMEALRQYESSPDPEIQAMLPMLRDNVRRIDAALERLAMQRPRRQEPEVPGAAEEAPVPAPSASEAPQPVETSAPTTPAVAPAPPTPPTPEIPPPTPIETITGAAPAPTAPPRPRQEPPTAKERYEALVGDRAAPADVWRTLKALFERQAGRDAQYDYLATLGLTAEQQRSIVDAVNSTLARGEDWYPAPEVEPPAPPQFQGFQAGDRLRTVSGRVTSPWPRMDYTTNQRAINSERRLEAWLLDEARQEVAGDDYRTTLLQGMNPGKMSQADRDTLNIFLFGEVEGATPEMLVTPEPPAPPTAIPPVQPTPKPVPEARIANSGLPYDTQQNAEFALKHTKGISPDTHEWQHRPGYGYFIVPKGSAVPKVMRPREGLPPTPPEPETAASPEPPAPVEAAPATIEPSSPTMEIPPRETPPESYDPRKDVFTPGERVSFAGTGAFAGHAFEAVVTGQRPDGRVDLYIERVTHDGHSWNLVRENGIAFPDELTRLPQQLSAAPAPVSPTSPTPPAPAPEAPPAPSPDVPPGVPGTETRALQDRIFDAYTRHAPKMRDDVKQNNTSRLARAITTGHYTELLDLKNAASRKVFTEMTGVKLPGTLKGTQALFTGQPFPIKPAAAPPAPVEAPEAPTAPTPPTDADYKVGERIRFREDGIGTIVRIRMEPGRPTWYDVDTDDGRRINGIQRSEINALVLTPPKPGNRPTAPAPETPPPRAATPTTGQPPTEFLARLTPFGPDDLAKLPKPPVREIELQKNAQVWFKATVPENREAWTEGHVLDTKRPPYPNIEASLKPDAPGVRGGPSDPIDAKSIWNPVAGDALYASTRTPVALYTPTAKHEADLVLFEGSNEIVAYKKKYVAYFQTQYPGYELKVLDPKHPAGVYHQGQMVGLMMPYSTANIEEAAKAPVTPANVRQWLAQAQPGTPPPPPEPVAPPTPPAAVPQWQVGNRVQREINGRMWTGTVERTRKGETPEGDRVAVRWEGYNTWQWESPDKLQPAQEAAETALTEAEEGRGTAPEEPVETAEAFRRLTVALGRVLSRQESLKTVRDLQALADTAYGGTRAAGTYDMRDVYDAVEVALNNEVWRLGATGIPDATAGLAQAQDMARFLHDLSNRMPTQTIRTAEQDQFQQFSTPLDYAYAAAWVANLQPHDVVLEPSAGTGTIAGMGRNALHVPQNVHVNEIAERRLEALRQQGYTHVMKQDARFLHSLLYNKLDPPPTVVLMNPPFSQSALQGRHEPMAGAHHVEQALKLLPEGGRLVAIVGRGMKPPGGPEPTQAREGTGAAYKEWFDKIGRTNTIRAVIGVAGEVYSKQGTHFATNLIVIDRGGATVAGSILRGNVETIPQLLETLQEIRDVRTSLPAVPHPERPQPAAPTPAPGATEPQPPRPVDAVGPGEEPGGAVRGPAGAPGGRAEGHAGVDGGAGGAPAVRPGRLGDRGTGSTAGRPGGEVSAPGGVPTPEPAPRTTPAVQPDVSPEQRPAPGQPVGGDAGTQLAQMSPEEFGALFDEEAQAQAPAPTPPPARKPTLADTLVGAVQGLGKPVTAADIDQLINAVKQPTAGTPPAPLPPAAPAPVPEPAQPTRGASGLAMTPEQRARIQDILGEGVEEESPPYGDWLAGVDPAKYTRLEPVLQTVLDQTIQAGGTPRDFARGLLQEFGAAIKPYAMQFVANLGKQPAPPQPAAAPPAHDPTATAAPEGQPEALEADTTASLYVPYHPQRLNLPGGQPHKGALVETAAMGAVAPPLITYEHHIPQDVIERGDLSIAQMEPVIAAGQAHSKMLPGGVRRGYFDGDGTGVGKGRIIAGIFYDNWLQGRKRGVWISKNNDLVGAARRDWVGVTGRDENEVFTVQKPSRPAGVPIDRAEGILFMPYDTLKRGEKKEGGRTRLDQLYEWLGPNFDGVIVFDESHLMGNNISSKGSGDTFGQEASQRARAGQGLRDLFPQARVGYFSATGATELKNLGYLDRLGLWGAGTDFATKSDFINKMETQGIAGMEALARDMKALGMYTARSLSFQGIGYDRLTLPFGDAETAAYNRIAAAWQQVTNYMEDALEATGGADDRNQLQKQAAESAFWGAQQRFFNQYLTSLKTPAMIAHIDTYIQDPNGGAAVIQLTNTNDAQATRQLAVLDDDAQLEDLTLSPMQILMDYIMESFPVAQQVERVDDQGHTYTETLMGDDGRPVENPEAVAIRNRLLDEMATLQADIPDGPLEQLLDHFGVENVAEITGRKQRLVYRENAQGKMERIRETGRTDRVILQDHKDFNDDKKRILVFSGKGDTGMDYHAGLEFKNQRQRHHYVLQPGWQADRAVQAMGRTHRTNEAQPPIYYLMTTDLPAEARFISSIARRLDQLGALTRGARQASSNGLFNERDNLENQYARDALYRYLLDVERGRNVEITKTAFMEQTGLDPDEAATIPITRFLNRLFMFPVATQHEVMGGFNARLDRRIEEAVEDGTFNVGMEVLRADRITKVREMPLSVDAETGASTQYVELKMENKPQPLTFAALPQRLVQRQALSRGVSGTPIQYGVNKRSGRVYLFTTEYDQTDRKTGARIPLVRRFGPMTEESQLKSELSDEKYDTVSEDDAARLWAAEIAALPEYLSHTEHLIAGVLLPHYSKLPESEPKIYRLRTTDGEHLLGRVVPPGQLKKTMQNFGLTIEGATVTIPDYTPAEMIDRVLQDRYELRLSNNWRLRRSLAGGQARVEMLGLSSAEGRNLEQLGGIMERPGYQAHWYLPTGPRGADILGVLMQNQRVVEETAPSEGGTRGVKEPTTPYGAERVEVETAPSGAEVYEPPAGYVARFAQSQVVDDQGRLKPVYHGTGATFEQFDPERSGSGAGGDLYGPGFYFTDNPDVATGYATASASVDAAADIQRQIARLEEEMAAHPGDATLASALRFQERLLARVQTSPNVRPVYLNIQRPFDVNGTTSLPQVEQEVGQDVAAHIRRISPMYKANTIIKKGGIVSNQVIYDTIMFLADSSAAGYQRLQQLGYDGITHIGGAITGRPPHRVWIAFHPDQILPVFTPEVSYAQRPNTPPGASVIAEHALADLDAAGRQPLRSASGAVERMPPAPLPGQPGPLGTRLVGKALASDAYLDRLRSTGAAAFVGQEAPTPHDIAVLAQAVRDPRIERLFWIFMKGDMVADVQVVSSRLPGSSEMFPTGDFPGLTRTEHIQMLQRQMKQVGADTYMLIHNHPAGDPTPSTADKSMTQHIARDMPGFRGHVVINSGKYATIDPEGKPTIHELDTETLWASTEGFDPFLDIPPMEVPHDLTLQKILRPEDAARFAQRLNIPEGYVVAFYRASKGRVQAIELVPTALFTRTARMALVRHLKQQQRATGGAEVLTYYDGSEETVEATAVDLYQTGVLRDHYSPHAGHQEPSMAIRAPGEYGRYRPQGANPGYLLEQPPTRKAG